MHPDNSATSGQLWQGPMAAYRPIVLRMRNSVPSPLVG